VVIHSEEGMEMQATAWLIVGALVLAGCAYRPGDTAYWAQVDRCEDGGGQYIGGMCQSIEHPK
jgi:hypothetical protein